VSDASAADQDESAALVDDGVDGDLTALTRDELRRRAEAPLPRSLLEFLR
jgi:hypothetical protein